MNKTVIHVGLHKTASTFLQENVWPKLKGFTYLTRPYTQHNHAFNQLQYADDSLYQKELIVRELDKIAPGNLLLSDEAFSGKPIFFSYINRSIITKRLKDLFPDATIIIFIRDQKDIILSHYSSYIKMPFGTKKIEHFFRKPGQEYTYQDYLEKPNLFDLNTLYYNVNDYFIHLDCFLYSRLIDLYFKLFEDVKIFLYEDLKTNQGTVLERLEGILGESIDTISPQKKNTSLSYSDLEKRRIMNQVLSPVSNQRLRRLLLKGIQMTPPLSNKDLKTVVSDFVGSYYTADNKILKERLHFLDWSKFSGKYG